MRSAAHPRVRGERALAVGAAAVLYGSTPRARGTARRQRPHGHRRRLIPACAGNGRPPPGPQSLRTAHPRVRGERGRAGAGDPVQRGSSPRARGMGEDVSPLFRLARLIPACAGNGRGCLAALSPGPAHPRVRGERYRQAIDAGGSDGSSPRARGTDRGRRPRVHRHRLIPACAGNGSRRLPVHTSPPAHPRVRGERMRPPRTPTGLKVISSRGLPLDRLEVLDGAGTA
jgi:hypothetical protein